MEKVTKDLRRSPSATTSSRSVAVEEAAPPPAAKATPAPATPLAPPARSIQREALATPDLVGESAGGGLQYGREIELPDSIPPSTRGRSAPTHPSAAAPTATAQSKTPSRRATDIASETPVSTRIPSGPARQPAAPSHAEGVESNGAPIVIPIQIPKGAGREIVLRIVISSED
jgi:hypothetical protein